MSSSTVSQLVANLLNPQSRQRNLQALSKEVYYWNNLKASLNYSAKKCEARHVIIEYFMNNGIGTRDRILCYLKEKIADIDAAQYALSYYDLRKMITEFADSKDGCYIFLGLLGNA